MSIIDEVFDGRQLDAASLSSFGFKTENGVLVYREDIMGGEFRAEVFVTPSGAARGRVIDLSFGEEYLPLDTPNVAGEFVGSVRQAYADVLRRIASSCLKKELFICDQSNRLAKEIFSAYGEEPDFPFESGKDRSAAVFRFPKNRKWYGILMHVKRSVLAGEPKNSDEKVDVINLRVGEELVPDVLTLRGVYPAYHMQKKNWVSVILDGTLVDGEILKLVDISRNYAVNKK